MRVPALVDTTGGAGYPAVLLYEYHADFWAAVQSNGYDLLVYRERNPIVDGGPELLDHQRVVWTYASKKASITLDQVTAPTSGAAALVWLYVGASSTVASDPSTSVGSATLDARAFPPVDTAGLTILTGRLDDAGAPVDTVVVPVGASVMVVLPLSRLGDPTAGTIQGRRIGQEPSGVVVEVLDADSDGAPATPANWTTTAGCAVTWREDLDGLALLIPLSPDEACDALLRVRIIYPIGTELRAYARVRAVTPPD
ncbi:MAG: hypothetical protein ACO26C_08485, partial [Ilumatobacteraceae bacterium]